MQQGRQIRGNLLVADTWNEPIQRVVNKILTKERL
jgi:hypothetical protein